MLPFAVKLCKQPLNVFMTTDINCVCASVDRMDAKVKEHRKHQEKHSGPKAERKKLKKHGGSTEEDERKRNPKAFAVQSAVRMAKTFHRSV